MAVDAGRVVLQPGFRRGAESEENLDVPRLRPDFPVRNQTSLKAKPSCIRGIEKSGSLGDPTDLGKTRIRRFGLPRRLPCEKRAIESLRKAVGVARTFQSGTKRASKPNGRVLASAHPETGVFWRPKIVRGDQGCSICSAFAHFARRILPKLWF